MTSPRVGYDSHARSHNGGETVGLGSRLKHSSTSGKDQLDTSAEDHLFQSDTLGTNLRNRIAINE